MARRLFLLSAIIVTANLLVGLFVHISADFGDEIVFFDALWRVVVGQRVGIDFHFAHGFGPYLLGSLLWRWLGPHYYVMPIAIYFFGLAIAFCGCVVAQRRLAHRMDLAFLFCVTLAFQVSAPPPFVGLSTSETLLGLAGFYNHLITSALAVLFLQTFCDGPISSPHEKAIEPALAASLLNIMFLIKISGVFLGAMILLAGCLLHGRTISRLLSLCAALALFAAITVIQVKAAGLEFLPLIHDYQLAAQAHSYSFAEYRGYIIAWSILGSVSLLVLFAVSQRDWGLHLRCTIVTIGTYVACQIALNMTNTDFQNMWLAPAAIVSLVVRMDTGAVIQQSARWKSGWYRFSPSRLAEFSAREAIPLLIFAIVLVPQIMSSLFAFTYGALVSLGIRTPYVVTAGKGISFRLPNSDLSFGVNDAVAAISSLDLGHQTIANLDFPNPFPVLFLDPPPKGVQVYWDFNNDVPRSALLGWRDIIGDACVVTIPTQPNVRESSELLAKIVRSQLAIDFKLVYRDALWNIYQKTRGCAADSSSVKAPTG